MHTIDKKKRKKWTMVGWFIPAFDLESLDDARHIRLWKQSTPLYKGHKVRITIEKIGRK